MKMNSRRKDSIPRVWRFRRPRNSSSPNSIKTMKSLSVPLFNNSRTFCLPLSTFSMI